MAPLCGRTLCIPPSWLTTLLVGDEGFFRRQFEYLRRNIIRMVYSKGISFTVLLINGPTPVTRSTMDVKWVITRLVSVFLSIFFRCGYSKTRSGWMCEQSWCEGKRMNGMRENKWRVKSTMTYKFNFKKNIRHNLSRVIKILNSTETNKIK